MSLWSDVWEYRIACFVVDYLTRGDGFYDDKRLGVHLYWTDRRGAPVPLERVRRIFDESECPEELNTDAGVIRSERFDYNLLRAVRCLRLISEVERYETALRDVDSPETSELYAAATQDAGEIPRCDSYGSPFPGWVLSAIYARLKYEAACDRERVIAEELERYQQEGLDVFASRPGYYQGKLIDRQRCWAFKGHQRFFRSLLEIDWEWSPGGWWTLYPERVPSSLQGFERGLCEQAITRINELKTRGKGEGGSLYDLLSSMQSYQTVPWKRFLNWAKWTTTRFWWSVTGILQISVDLLGWLLSFFIPPLRRRFYTDPPSEIGSELDDASSQGEK